MLIKMNPKNHVNITKFYYGCKVVDNIVTTEILYSRNKQGRIRIWQGFAAVAPVALEVKKSDKKGEWLSQQEHFLVPDEYINREPVPDKYCGIWWTEYSQEAGRVTVSQPKKIYAGKQIGKRNETTPFTQAILGLRSQYNSRIRKGASTKRKNLITTKNITFKKLLARDVTHPHRINVMLLHDFAKHETKIKYPCICQEKMDGTHYTIVYHPGILGEIDGFTRDRKSYGQKHLLRIAKPILASYPGLYISGELYLPNKPREYISGKSRLDTDESLELWVFDCFYIDKQLPFVERWELCREVIGKINSKFFKLVDSRICGSREDVDKYFNEKQTAGAEGIIVRNMDGQYEFGLTSNKRTHDALKYKSRVDAEFKIVGFTQGVGGNEGLIIWTLETASGKQFNAVPVGSHEKRHADFQAQAENFTAKGKMATVEFDGYSDDGTPIQPVFIMIREEQI